MASKIVEAISDWILQDPEAAAKIRESMRPHLEVAWDEGYEAGYNDGAAEQGMGWEPEKDQNPYTNGKTA